MHEILFSFLFVVGILPNFCGWDTFAWNILYLLYINTTEEKNRIKAINWIWNAILFDVIPWSWFSDLFWLDLIHIPLPVAHQIFSISSTERSEWMKKTEMKMLWFFLYEAINQRVAKSNGLNFLHSLLTRKLRGKINKKSKILTHNPLCTKYNPISGVEHTRNIASSHLFCILSFSSLCLGLYPSICMAGRTIHQCVQYATKHQAINIKAICISQRLHVQLLCTYLSY